MNEDEWLDEVVKAFGIPADLMPYQRDLLHDMLHDMEHPEEREPGQCMDNAEALKVSPPEEDGAIPLTMESLNHILQQIESGRPSLGSLMPKMEAKSAAIQYLRGFIDDDAA